MTTNKKVKDFLQSAMPKPGAGPGIAPQGKGRPAGPEYEKITVCLYPKHVLFLDKVVLAIREKAGKRVKRAELIRAVIDNMMVWVDPARADFEKVIKSLFVK